VSLTSRGGLILGCLTAFLAGNLNPYYLGPFLVLLTLLALGSFAESPINWKKLGHFAAIVGASIVGFLIQNFDTLFYAATHGRNPQAVSRDLWWMVKFGLTLPDLIFPRAHQNAWVDKISTSIYHAHVPPQLWGESQTAYIGIVSVVGLLVMIAVSIALISARKFEKITPFFWLTSATLLLSLMGGVNYLLGAFGFLLLRATNRASILLSCMALYFLCENIPQDFNKRWGALLAAALIMIGVWDQLPRYPVWEEAIRQHGWSDFKSDQEFFQRMENALPQGGMVFELPVKEYPETGSIRDMGDYEHFRPVLHTKELRFSYGTVKGRGDLDWQYRVSSESPELMISSLESYGFCAILINRKAYEDHGESLRKQLLAAHAHMLMENHDFLIFNISASLHPVLPLRGTGH
jgi:phosphoglycerol transferase